MTKDAKTSEDLILKDMSVELLRRVMNSVKDMTNLVEDGSRVSLIGPSLTALYSAFIAAVLLESSAPMTSDYAAKAARRMFNKIIVGHIVETFDEMENRHERTH